LGKFINIRKICEYYIKLDNVIYQWGLVQNGTIIKTIEDKRNKEVILTKVVKNTEESAQSAEVAAAQEAAAKEAEKEIKAAKKAKRMDDLDDLLGDPFKEEDDLYKTKWMLSKTMGIGWCQANHSSVFP
jgi:hypothetical protein